MRILGIDPGYATTGFGILEAGRGSVQLLNYGTITTPTTLTFPERLVVLYDDMVQLIETVKPDAVAVEELFWGHNVTTGIGVSHGRGVILLAICKSGAPLFEYTPNQVKQAVVGYGGADKHQVMEMTRRILKMEKVARPDTRRTPSPSHSAMREAPPRFWRRKDTGNVLLSERDNYAARRQSRGRGLRRRGLRVPYDKLYACPAAARKACEALHLLQYQGRRL